jgi:hypothetical protein
LREQIGEYRTLVPGGVLPGSAAFPLELTNPDDLLKVKNIEIVVVDYSGNEGVKTIPIGNQWVETAKNLVLVNQKFTRDAAGNIKILELADESLAERAK